MVNATLPEGEMARRFPRDLSSVREVFALIDEFAAAHNLLPTFKEPVRLAVDEVFANMVRHNPSGVGDILVSLTHEGKRVVIRMVDQGGIPYDLTAHPLPDLSVPLENRKVGGLGVYFSRTVMDEVHYEHTNNAGIVTFVKNLET
jgi:serine/threonine-protein kinase RsbW